MKRSISNILLLALLLSGVGSAHATTWDAAADFSTSSNPIGAWAYGTGTTGTSFTAMFNAYTNLFGSDAMKYWQVANPQSLVPLIGKNSAGSPIILGSIFYPAGELVMHPGPATDAIVRWTAPTTGIYNYAGSFTLLDTNPSGVTGLVYGNGLQLYAGTLSGPGVNLGSQTVGGSETFAGSVALNAGQTLDFGINNLYSFYNDSTGFMAVITSAPVPEPGTMMLLGSGFLGLAVLSKRRKNA